MNKKVSLKDVAKKAGVGLGTASRVLNNNPSVSNEKREAVLRVIRELNYEPNAIARSLKMNKTKTIGVMIPDISSAFYPEIVRGIEDVANIYNYNIILCNTDMKKEKEKESLRMLKEKLVDGILFMSNTVNEELYKSFKEIDIPIVIIAAKDINNSFVNVNIDNEEAAYAAVDYLCKLEHKNIAMISGKFNDPNAGMPRINGYKKALEDNKIEIDESLIYEADFKYKTAYESMKKILNRDDIPTAIFVASDIMAMSASKAILENGFKIPDDISIVGFDGIEAANFFYPSITTIEQPRYEMGAVSMRLLTKIINNEHIEEKDVVLKYKLVKRESCCKLVKGV